MAFLLNYNFQLKNSSGGLTSSGQFSPFIVSRQNQSPKKVVTLSHFDDSFPLENPYLKPMAREEDEYKYTNNSKWNEDEEPTIFEIDDL